MTTQIDTNVYGDGTYVVEFHNVGSMQAPVTATLIGPDGLRNVTFTETVKPSLALASAVIGKATGRLA